MGCNLSTSSVTSTLEESGLGIWGKVGQQIEFPEGVVCERLKASEWSQKWTIKRLKSFKPTALGPLLEAKGATGLYEQLKDEMLGSCLGGMKLESGTTNPLAWNRPALNGLLKVKFNPLFNAKGLHVSLCYVEWMVFFNETMIQESRLWLEICDLAKHPNGWLSTTPGIPGSNEYDPQVSCYDWERDLHAFMQIRQPKIATSRDVREAHNLTPTSQGSTNSENQTVSSTIARTLQMRSSRVAPYTLSLETVSDGSELASGRSPRVQAVTVSEVSDFNPADVAE